MITSEQNKLVYRYDAEQLWVEPWGNDSLRIRATKECSMPEGNMALTGAIASDRKAEVSICEEYGSITNGKITAVIYKSGKMIIKNQKNEILLEEYSRNRKSLTDPKCSAIEVEAREFKAIPGGDYHLTYRMESQNVNEKIYGMGQYQQPYLNLKGLDLELAHRNSQASVPFAVSSLGYGFLWNNPAIGRVVFGKNIMSYEAYSTKMLDFWIVAGDTPA